MNSSALWIILAAMAVIVAVLFLVPVSESSTELPVATTASTEGGESLSATGRILASVLTVDAGPDLTVGEREIVQLHGQASTSTGGSITYAWSAHGGLGFFSNPNAADTSYTAPSACDCEQSVTLTLTATAADGTRASDSLTLSVRDPLACPTAQSTCTGGSQAVMVIDSCTSTTTSACPAPDVPCDDPCISEAPVEPACAQVPVPCRCADDCGATWDAAWPSASEPVAGRDRAKPEIGRQYPSHVPEAGSFQLSASIRNPACLSVCFSWTANKGWFEGADTLTPVYHAPETDRYSGEPVTITLTIYDASGSASYDQIRFTVDNLDYAGPQVP
jgi:hypothetical protein